MRPVSENMASEKLGLNWSTRFRCMQLVFKDEFGGSPAERVTATYDVVLNCLVSVHSRMQSSWSQYWLTACLLDLVTGIDHENV